MPRPSVRVLTASLLTAATLGASRHAQTSSLALEQGATEEAFGEYSYFDAYPVRDPDNLIDPGLWTTCWAMTQAERYRLADLARNAPPEYRDELREASIHYQVAEIYYSEIVRGMAIFEGAMMRDVNAALEIEQQALIGGAPYWLASNAADCIYRMPESSMPEFAELYPWLANGLGTFYTN